MYKQSRGPGSIFVVHALGFRSLSTSLNTLIDSPRMQTERGPRVNVTVGVHSSCRVSTTLTDLSVPTVDSERSNTWCQQRLACNFIRTNLFGVSETRPETASATFRNSRNSARCAPSAAFAGNISYSYVSGGRVLSGARRTASRLSCKPDFHPCSNGDDVSVTVAGSSERPRDGSERIGRAVPVAQSHNGLGWCLGCVQCSLYCSPTRKYSAFGSYEKKRM